MPDYRKITDIAHSHGLPTIIDNTVLTPALFRPIEHGFDIVVYSTTKFIGGHGVHIGGAIVDSGKFPWAKDPAKWPEFTAPDPAYHGMVFEEALRPIGNIAYILHIRTHWLRDTGACQSPFASFLTLLGVETLHLRMERHSQNALAVAQFLEKHPAVAWVNYPGLPSHPDHARAQKYLPDGAGRDRRIRHQGRQGGRRQADQQRQALQPPGQYRRREVADHPPGHDHALAAHARGTGADRRDARVRPPVGRHRGRAGHHRRTSIKRCKASQE